jgi:hypothetical protein
MPSRLVMPPPVAQRADLPQIRARAQRAARERGRWFPAERRTPTGSFRIGHARPFSSMALGVLSALMTEPAVTRALGMPRRDRRIPRAASVVALSLVCSAGACGRVGYDLLPRDDDSVEAGGRGGAGSSAASGAGGAPIDGDGGLAGAGAVGGLGGDAGAAGTTSGAGGDAGSTSAGAGGAGGAGGSTSLPLCTDGLQNGDELATDCGGSACVPCACTFGAPEVLGNPNYPGNQLWGPSLSDDALTLYVAFIVPGFNEQIGVSTRPDRGNTFGFASVLPAPVNQSIEGTPHISLDQRSLYFFSERAGSGGVARDLYVATRSDPSAPFDTASPLSSVNSSFLDHLPWVSADELILYFASERSGTMDIWRSTRASRADAFGSPAAVTEINSSAEDNGMTLTRDERTIIFASTRPNGAGDYDLYRALRAGTDQPFSLPEPLSVINTSAVETDPSLSPDGQELFFVSTRNGATELWRSSRTCP